jgi:hypothetical protein
LEENYRPDVLFVRMSADVVRTSVHVRVYPADAVLTTDGFLLSANAVKTASARTRKKKKFKKNLKNFFLVVVAGLERENFFSIFNFQFSIPKIPKLPKLPVLRRLRGRSREKKKVFSP